MSFSSEVKEELARQFGKSRHCQIAELAAVVAMEGHIQWNPLSLQLNTDNMTVLGKYAVLMQKVLEVDITRELSPEDTIRVLRTTKLLKENELWKLQLESIAAGTNPTPDLETDQELEEFRIRGQRVDGLTVQKTCCRRAFIRGAFLTSGSISNPNKSYHFEIVCHTEVQAKQLQELMESFDTDPKIVLRKNHYVVYLKDGSQIVDMLNVMEAYVSLMNLENVRIIKEMRNSVNRKVNCETANISKTVNAAVKQIQDIERIRDTIGLDELPPQLQEMALLRLEYPDTALKELGELLDPPVGKSGVNHRFRKLAAIAEDLR